MNREKIQPFTVRGISMRTTNENGQSAQDIPLLWDRFFAENISAGISDKADDTIYCIYTDYEKDYTKPYTVVLGHRVNQPANDPQLYTEVTIAGDDYDIFTAKGRMSDAIVFHEWVKIWNSGLDRAYKTDFEVYGAKAQNPDQAEVDIFIGIK